MAEASNELEGPDFGKGYETGNVRDGEMLLGHAFGEPGTPHHDFAALESDG